MAASKKPSTISTASLPVLAFTMSQAGTPIVVVAMTGWNKLSRQALTFALTLSDHVTAIHVAEEDESNDLAVKWKELVEEPARHANLPAPVQLRSPYRFVVAPLVDFIVRLATDQNCRVVAIVPELVERRWYHYFLHSSVQRF